MLGSLILDRGGALVERFLELAPEFGYQFPGTECANPTASAFAHRARNSLERWPERSGFTAAINPTLQLQRVFLLTYDCQPKKDGTWPFFLKKLMLFGIKK